MPQSDELTGKETRTANKEQAATGSGNTGSGNQQNAPGIQLPKGGGAIRGIGEKFSVNAASGTGSASVPIYTSQGRSGFGPKLSLSYDSGSGNGPFGIGWHMSVPSLTRKTDKGLPRYDDADESDVFLMSDAEDLMPVLSNQRGLWVSVPVPGATPDGTAYTIKRYRPRSEGMFARIERWQRDKDGDIHWRATTRDNITNIYGQNPSARVADPSDATRVFKWLLDTTFDDKGNVIAYGYIPEDTVGMDLTAAGEQNRVNGNAPFANAYVKRIQYGNQTPFVPGEDLTARKDWLFEVVFDYGEHNPVTPMPSPDPARQWVTRADPFSTFRSAFEVRTYRLCQRVLMFHHFPAPAKGLAGYDALVRSTDFVYDQEDPLSQRMGNRIATRLLSATQTGYTWDVVNSLYTTRAFPPVQFAYSAAVLDTNIYDVAPESLANVPAGLSGNGYQWIDLDGEGSAGILYEDGAALYYKRNASPANTTLVNGVERAAPLFGAQERVPTQPRLVSGGKTQFIDLQGDGHQDMVELQGTSPGYYRHGDMDGWEGFRTFDRFPNIDTGDPNVKFIDVDGDGLTDILVSEDDVLSWHRSLGKHGFGDREYARKPFDEEKGPALIFADPTQCIFLGDMTGDGLTDIVRVRSGEVCYWPNRGYGRFGAKVSMDNAPCFDTPDLFDQRRIRLADIDGSGTTDILYLRNDGVAFYFNQSGNSWTDEQVLTNVPAINNLASIHVMDLFGNGLACLAWSSPLPSDAGRPIRYIDLLGGQKPYLLTSVKNNMGLETRIRYASSAKFYVQDREAGTPWVTRLAFPVYVVERLEVFDYIGRTRVVSTYRYRHGYFDGVEREFRGFGFVEQRDAESFGDSASLFTADTDTEADALHAPPIVTKTWYHTGAWPNEGTILQKMAGDYFTAPGSTGAGILPDTILPVDVYLPDGSRLPYSLTGEEAREAVRAFKGSILRQEVYADDGGLKACIPYSVSERNYTVECFQPRAGNRYAVFFTHARETIDHQYERNPKDPRVAHSVVLDVNPFGDTLHSVSATYARNIAQAGIALAPTLAPGVAPDLTTDPSLLAQPEQVKPWFTVKANTFTPAIDNASAYRGPMPVEVLTYELTRPARPDESVLYDFSDIGALVSAAELISFETTPDPGKTQKRLIGDERTLYLKNDLTPLPLTQNDTLGLVYEKYSLTLTAALAQQILVTGNSNPQKPVDAAALNNILSGDGGYVNGVADSHWWTPSGRTIFSPVPQNPPDPFVQDAAYAAKHFFLPQAQRDPFGQYARQTYDVFDLLPVQTQDALGNTTGAVNDYRVLQPSAVTDPNGNQIEAAYDALGMLCATAVEGKIVAPGQTESGDSLSGLTADLSQADTDNFFNAADPLAIAPTLLGSATTRFVYDLQRFGHTAAAHPADPTQWEPVYVATIARETHTIDLVRGAQTAVQVSFSYSDGQGREIQRKVQAEQQRWAGTGWVILNNKAKPIRQYEPFFSTTHFFEFANKVGITATVFYDPLQRVVATLRPDHSWEKVLVNPWLQVTWDGNDTTLLDPGTDPDVSDLFGRLPAADYLPTWYGLRTDPVAAAAEWPDPVALKAQQDAAARAAVHGGTPAAVFFDAMGRPFLTVGHNRSGVVSDQYYATRKQLDVTGNPLSLMDALGRVVMRDDYDLGKKVIHQASMDTGDRWTLNDVSGKPIRLWDSKGFVQLRGYDELRRPLSLTVTGNGLNNVLAEKTVYGDSAVGAPPNPAQANLLTRAYRSYDNAGIITSVAVNPGTGNSEGYDFKGNLIRSTRQLLQGAAYRTVVDWNQNQTPDETFMLSNRFDALSRIIQQTAPHSNQGGAKVNVLQSSYNEAGLLETVDVWLQQNAEPGALLDAATATQHAVTNIDYDAKGQRVLIAYGTPVNTTYQYDPETFRLVNVTTTRKNDGILLQDLQYYYDPVGNITHTQDDADIQDVVYFNNRRVEPSADYVYDAVYQLLKATGREHLGQNGGVPNAPAASSYNDGLNVNLPQPGDGKAMGVYNELYAYDPVGNVQKVQHIGASPASPGWTRTYAYSEPSLLEPALSNNRLTATTVGGTTDTYSVAGNGYDAHGNMLSMPQLQLMQWDFKDQLQMTQRQRVNNDDTDGAQHQGERTYYIYDATGERVRKVTESARGALVKQRIYLGPFEVYREYDNAGAEALERQTLHVMDDKHRVAIAEVRTLGDDGSPAQLIRYQLGNHLDSACLELDDTGEVISYEEYFPFGSAAYQAMDQAIKAAAKRYRYIGKERDEETGLFYHGVRYYASWLGRWTSCDPAGIVDGPDLYRYSRNNPIKLSDPNGMTPPQDPPDEPPPDPPDPPAPNPDNDPPPDPPYTAQIQNGGFSASALINMTGIWTSEFTLQGLGGFSAAGPNGAGSFLYHYRNVISDGVELGLQAGFGGAGPPTLGTGLLNVSLHLGQQPDDALTSLRQTLVGAYFTAGFVWGQNPLFPGSLSGSPPSEGGGANPVVSAQVAVSRLHFQQEGITRPHLHQTWEFDFDAGLTYQRFGAINGVSVVDFTQLAIVLNSTFPLAGNWQGNVELGVTGNAGFGGVVPGTGPVTGPTGIFPFPVSATGVLGVGFTWTHGDYALSFEPYYQHEAFSTVATAGGTGSIADGGHTWGLKFDFAAVNTRAQRGHD